MAWRTALIVPVPQAEPHVAALRLAHDSSARLGVPAHVTVLFPFAPLDEIDEAALRDLFAGFAPFSFRLERIEKFSAGTVWLSPCPRRPFEDLTAAVWRRWPRHPPYGGAYADVIPHLTVSDEPIEPTLPLPILCEAREVVLLVERRDGQWVENARFPLGPGDVQPGIA